MKLLLTGRPGVGKTTALRRALENLPLDAGGFYTEELRRGGRRVGFLVRDLEGREGLLAHVDLKEGPRVGRYRIDLRSFEAVAIGALERALREKALVVVDEIGKMELLSEAFRDAVRRVLRSPKHVLGVITLAEDPLVGEIRGMKGVEIWEVSPEGRDRIPEAIVRRLQEELG